MARHLRKGDVLVERHVIPDAPDVGVGCAKRGVRLGVANKVRRIGANIKGGQRGGSNCHQDCCPSLSTIDGLNDAREGSGHNCLETTMSGHRARGRIAVLA
eukprot:5254770-Heterocapsa_arctica.AAC.1